MSKKSQIVKNQHYVPRCYLKNFLDENEKIAVLDKQKLKIYRTNMNNIANQNHFYDLPENEYFDVQAFEKMFNAYETDYGQIIKEIFYSLDSIEKDSFNNTLDNYKDFLAFYFCLQWVRTLQTRKFASHIFKLMLEQIKNLLGFVDTEIVVHEDKLMPLQAQFIINILSGKIPKYLASQQFFIFINTTDIPYYCSDNPAIMDSSFCKKDGRGKGFFSYGMNFYLPLSSKYCLLIVDKRLLKTKPQYNTIILQDSDSIIYANDLQIKKATSQIYCYDNKFLELEKEYIKSLA